ncbi:MAG TPA: hypothetical protein VG247_01550 [Pseudonocardiaceae bacterium]|jgi:hypothetical protein|nr:hypothetical protein [Pseudonocardiaceae bacterium]
MWTLLSGLGLLVLGGVVGVVVDVAVKDLLRKQKARLQHWLRRRKRRKPGRGATPVSGHGFKVGPLRTSYVLVEGDGQDVIAEQAVRVLVDHRDVELPDEMQSWRKELERDHAAKAGSGDDHPWNGLRYAVQRLRVEREGVDETPAITLSLQHSDYLNFLTAQQLDREFADGTTPRGRYLDPDDPTAGPPFMANSFGANVLVITKDDRAVFSRRSQRVAISAGRWGPTMIEGVSRSLDSQGRTPPNLYSLARRGLEEETSLFADEYRLELLAIGIAEENHQWGGLFVATLYDLTVGDLTERLTRGAPDRWEQDGYDSCVFEAAAILRYLLRPDRRDCWSPAGPALAYTALVHRYGRLKVERTIGQVLRSLPG